MSDLQKTQACAGFDVERIKALIPHRYPMLLVDKVDAYVPFESMQAKKSVSSNEPYFEGHFPTASIMPGVLIVESLAQASGLLFLSSIGLETGDHARFFLAGLDQVRFRHMVKPGCVLDLDIQVLKTKGRIWQFACKASVDSQVAVEATIMLAHDLSAEELQKGGHG